MTSLRLSLVALALTAAACSPEEGEEGQPPAASTTGEIEEAGDTETASYTGDASGEAPAEGIEPPERPEAEPFPEPEDGDGADDSPVDDDLSEAGIIDGGWDPIGDDDSEDDGTDGGTEEEAGDPCETNEVTFRNADDDLPQQKLNSFVFHDDGATIWIVGYETGESFDACEWAASPEDASGYELMIELTGDRTADSTKTWMDDDDGTNIAELRLENGGSGALAEAENNSGSLVLAAYTAGETLEVSGMTGALDDGSHIEEGTFTACYCGAMKLK